VLQWFKARSSGTDVLGMPPQGSITVLEAEQPQPTMWRMYRPLLWTLALAGAVLWLSTGWSPDRESVILVAALVLLGNIADLYAVTVQRGMRVSTTHFAAPFAIIVAGVPAGIIAAAGCLLGRRLFNRSDWNSFDIAVNVVAVTISGTVWQLGQALSHDSVVMPAIATVVSFALVRVIVNLGWSVEARSRGIDIPTVTVPIGRLMLAAALLFTPAVALLEIDNSSLSTTFVLLALPFVATQFLIGAFGRERELNDDLEQANLSLTESLVNALDARDPYSAGHSLAVAVYSRDIAREIGLPDAEVQRLHLAGLLHDIGKIAVPDAILRKPAALTNGEFDEIRKHPAIGEQILAPSRHLEDILPAVRHHHERIDGKGYPDRLRDADIPLHARIIAVADAYDAMTSDRPYRDAMPPELAQRVLVQNQGMQHDPFIVSAFRRVLLARGTDYAAGRGPDFATSARLRDLMREIEDAHSTGERDAA
jgi:putative nucleotidyltransferase with HDIG domain